MADILITDDLWALCAANGWTEQAESAFAEAGLTVRPWRAADEETVPGARGLLVNAPRISERELELLPDLTTVVRFGSGVDNVDAAACRARAVEVRNIPGPIGDEMVAAVTGLVVHRVMELDGKARRYTERGWSSRQEVRAVGAAHATVGFVGSGRIAAGSAEALRGLGMRVQFASPSGAAGHTSGIGERVGLDALCRTSDVVVVLTPLRSDTHGLIDAELIGRMRPGAHLVAISRGGVVDQPAALEALREGRIGSLHLDVLDPEPTDPEELPGLRGLSVTPHNAAWSRAFFSRTFEQAIDLFRAAL